MINVIFNWIMFFVLVICLFLALNGTHLPFYLYLIGWISTHDYDLYLIKRKESNETD